MRFFNNLVTIVFCFLPFALLAQNEIQIGNLSGGKLTITNGAFLERNWGSKLENSGEMHTKSIVVSSDQTKAFIWCKVTGNSKNINCIGTTVAISKGKAYYCNTKSEYAPLLSDGPGIGGSVTHSCTGAPCTNCELRITSALDISCICKDGGCSNCKCNHTITLEINGNIGL